MSTEDSDSITVSLEIPIDGVHAAIIDDLENNGMNVEEQLEARFQRATEETIHELYQEAKYSG